MTFNMNMNDDDFVKRVVTAAFPQWRGRKVRVEYGVRSMSVRSYWDGGSKSTFAGVNLATLETMPAPSSHPVFDRAEGVDDVRIPDGYAIVEHVIFRGKDLGMRIHVPGNAPALPPGLRLTTDELHVLEATAGYKSSYGGVRDYRAYKCAQNWGMTQARIDAARQSLCAKGLLNSRRAITAEGRNALERNRS